MGRHPSAPFHRSGAPVWPDATTDGVWQLAPASDSIGGIAHRFFRQVLYRAPDALKQSILGGGARLSRSRRDTVVKSLNRSIWPTVFIALGFDEPSSKRYTFTRVVVLFDQMTWRQNARSKKAHKGAHPHLSRLLGT